MGKPLSWQWKLTIAFVVFLFALLVTAFTPAGADMVRGWIDSAYKSCPEALRGRQAAADWFLRLAWWEGFVCGRDKKAVQMYLEFIGLYEDGEVYENPEQVTNPNDYWDQEKETGWGWVHPQAATAFYEMLMLYKVNHSGEMTGKRAYIYYALFYEHALSRKGRPHPSFYKHWQYVKPLIAAGRIGVQEPALEEHFSEVSW
jgi:hypothetical protein